MISVDTKGVATVGPDLDVVRAWVEALESGEFRQTDGSLRKDNRYCCLGVLCELAARNGVIQSAVELTFENEHGDQVPTGDFSYDSYDAFLPPSVQEWAFGSSENEDSHNPELIDDDGYRHPASDLNDTQHYSFDQIAAAIRRTYNV